MRQNLKVERIVKKGINIILFTINVSELQVVEQRIAVLR